MCFKGTVRCQPQLIALYWNFQVSGSKYFSGVFKKFKIQQSRVDHFQFNVTLRQTTALKGAGTSRGFWRDCAPGRAGLPFQTSVMVLKRGKM